MKRNVCITGLLLSTTLFPGAAVLAKVQQDNAPVTPAPLHEESFSVDSLYYLPPPPKEGDAAFENDKAAYHNGFKLKGTERWQQAAIDADLH